MAAAPVTNHLILKFESSIEVPEDKITKDSELEWDAFVCAFKAEVKALLLLGEPTSTPNALYQGKPKVTPPTWSEVETDLNVLAVRLYTRSAQELGVTITVNKLATVLFGVSEENQEPLAPGFLNPSEIPAGISDFLVRMRDVRLLEDIQERFYVRTCDTIRGVICKNNDGSEAYINYTFESHNTPDAREERLRARLREVASSASAAAYGTEAGAGARPLRRDLREEFDAAEGSESDADVLEGDTEEVVQGAVVGAEPKATQEAAPAAVDTEVDGEGNEAKAVDGVGVGAGVAGAEGDTGGVPVEAAAGPDAVEPAAAEAPAPFSWRTVGRKLLKLGTLILVFAGLFSFLRRRRVGQ